MANTDSGSSATPWLALFIGALLVAVGVLGFFMFTGAHLNNGPTMPTHVNVTVKSPVTNH